MGIGDAIMATADVKRMHASNGRPVVVLGRGDRVIWSEVFDHNPRISRARVGSQVLYNGPGIRPYIAGRTDHHWTWRRMRNQQPGEIYLTDAEREFGARFKSYILVEPNVKANGHANKAWSFERWQAVVDQELAPMVQCGGPSTRWLRGVERVETPTFRLACSVLAACKGFVGTEGALHHAAAALGIPAVVLWAEFIAPDVTGYAGQVNIRHAGEPCGLRVPCGTCAESMAAISVAEVLNKVAAL